MYSVVAPVKVSDVASVDVKINHGLLLDCGSDQLLTLLGERSAPSRIQLAGAAKLPPRQRVQDPAVSGDAKSR